MSAPSTRSAGSSRRTPLARERGYTPGTFSFNSGNGRCPTCSGCGFEHVEMQFLSDVYLRCPDCDGRRYRGEVLEARIEGKSIADVLELTVHEAARFFRQQRGGAGPPRSAPRRGPRLPQARPAGADPLRRRGAAAEARRAPRRPRRRGGQALPLRRADDRPALRRRRQAGARVPPAPCRRAFARRDRAQPGRHPRVRLDHRPRTRGRRRRRGDRLCGSDFRNRESSRFSHR